MSYFEDIYKKRLNRYGQDYQSRIQTQRERQFELLLQKSVYRVDFDFNEEEQPGLLERYKQDETNTRAYLLTRVNLDIPYGTILYIPNKDQELVPWMIYWLEEIKASGYNRYVVLKMTHTITWSHETWPNQPNPSFSYVLSNAQFTLQAGVQYQVFECEGGIILDYTAVDSETGEVIEVPGMIKNNIITIKLVKPYINDILINVSYNKKQKDKESFTSLVYFYGQEDNMLKDEIRSRSRMDTVYSENLKLSFMIMPTNANLKKDDYFEIGEGELLEAYRVTGYDRQSTPGVEYVSVDPIYEFDKTLPPQQHAWDNPDDFYWINNGVIEDGST